MVRHGRTACLPWQDAPKPKTGQHDVEEELRQEALSFFFAPEAGATCSPTTGGVNNVGEAQAHLVVAGPECIILYESN